MALVTCPECGKEISDKASSCPYCGNPMAVLFEKPAAENDSKDKEEYDKYMALARRAKGEGNISNAAKYYDLAVQKNPQDWESSFYQVYFSSMNCKVGEIVTAATSIASCIDGTMQLIREQVKSDQQSRVLSEIVQDCTKAASMMGDNLVNFSMSTTQNTTVTRSKLVAVDAINVHCVTSLQKYFPHNDKVIAEAAKKHIAYLQGKSFLAQDYRAKYISLYTSLIRKVDSNYTQPEPRGGCYVATCVYGSYDCPQVWTLRRYRDNTLAETWYGRLFIHTYYAISPTIVKWFGHTEWFKKMWRGKLDRMVSDLNQKGVQDTPYKDQNW